MFLTFDIDKNYFLQFEDSQYGDFFFVKESPGFVIVLLKLYDLIRHFGKLYELNHLIINVVTILIR